MNANLPHGNPSSEFAALLLAWDQPLPGRGLPWAFNSDPYIVWVSEVMLQQTRAETVVPYFEEFIRRYPTVCGLAAASIDQVLQLWSGLGYYTRAQNLHVSAKLICHDHAGQFPQTYSEVVQLPGIGRSTAGAILALAFGLQYPILDGNAKRVYTRFFGVDDETESVRIKALWELADSNTPQTQVREYTQRIMDLGATVCLPRRPQCNCCPLAQSCYAHRNDLTSQLPLKRKSKKLREQSTAVVVATDAEGRILLERRSATGIWGGLWSFPEYPGKPDDLAQWMQSHYCVEVNFVETWQTVVHDFTHFRLLMIPMRVEILKCSADFFKRSDIVLLRRSTRFDRGIPAPIMRLIEQTSSSLRQSIRQ